jgi:hypothetical protein
MRPCFPGFASVIVLLILAFPHPVHAQEQAATTPPAASLPGPFVVGGHDFVPTSFIKGPFIRTYFRTGLGFGITPELQVPVVVIDEKQIVGLKGSLLFALLETEYQQALRDWVAVFGRVAVLGRMANETTVLLSQGVTLVTGFDLGWLLRIHQSERLLLSGSFTLSNSSLTDVYLQRFVDGIIENGGVTPGNTLVQTIPVLRGKGGVHGVYAFSELTGVTFLGEVAYGESTDRRTSDSWFYSLGGTVDFNFYRHDGVPVGVVIGFQTGLDPHGDQAGGKTTQIFFARIGYTGSREFALGLEVRYDLVPVRNMPDKAGFISALVDIRLLF